VRSYDRRVTGVSSIEAHFGELLVRVAQARFARRHIRTDREAVDGRARDCVTR
jgi:hypothetical protein